MRQWVGAAYIPSKSMNGVAINGTGRFAFGFSYPYPSVIPVMLTDAYPLNPLDFPRTITSNHDRTRWHRAALFPTPLNPSEYLFLAALSTPIVVDPYFDDGVEADTDGKQVTVVAAITCNITEIKPIAASARLTEETVALLFDVVEWSFLLSTDLSFAQTDTGRLWHVDNLPHAGYRQYYRDARSRCPPPQCAYLTYTVDDEEGVVGGGKRLVSIVHVSSPETGLSFHLLQITPHAFYYAASERSRTIGIAIGVVAACVVMLSCIAVYLSIWGPLSAVKASMGLAARMKNDEASEATSSSSFLTEIRAIQHSFTMMNSKLLQARPFLPQHLLLEGERGSDVSEEFADEEMVASFVGVADDDEGDIEDGKAVAADSGLEEDKASVMLVIPNYDGSHTPHTGSIAGTVAGGGGGGGGGHGSYLADTRSETAMIDGTTMLSARGAATRSQHRHYDSSSSHHGSTVRVVIGGRGAPPLNSTSSVRGGHLAVPKGAPLKNNNLMAGGMQCRRVGVLSINLTNFHHGLSLSNQHASVAPSDPILALQSLLARHVEVASNGERGIIDTFQGDHFIVTFNAARPCAMVGRSGVLCALQLANSFEQALALAEQAQNSCGINGAIPSVANDADGGSAVPLIVRHRFSMGFASGRAMVGNMGTKAMKRLGVISPCFKEALQLEAVARHVGQRCVLSQRSMDGVDTSAYTLVLGRVLLGGGGRGSNKSSSALPTSSSSRFVIVRAAMEAIVTAGGNADAKKGRGGGGAHTVNVRSDEWLYEVGEGAAKDPYAPLNAAMEAYLGLGGTAMTASADASCAEIRKALLSRLGMAVPALSCGEGVSNVPPLAKEATNVFVDNSGAQHPNAQPDESDAPLPPVTFVDHPITCITRTESVNSHGGSMGAAPFTLTPTSRRANAVVPRRSLFAEQAFLPWYPSSFPTPNHAVIRGAFPTATNAVEVRAMCRVPSTGSHMAAAAAAGGVALRTTDVGDQQHTRVGRPSQSIGHARNSSTSPPSSPVLRSIAADNCKHLGGGVHKTFSTNTLGKFSAVSPRTEGGIDSNQPIKATTFAGPVGCAVLYPNRPLSSQLQQWAADRVDRLLAAGEKGLCDYEASLTARRV